MDIGASNWNEDDNANTTAAPDGAPEGMAPSGVNNVLRAHQGALKRFYSWTIPKITGGSGTAYTLSYAVAPGSLVDGMTHLVQFHAVNGASATLNVNTLGATPLHYYAAGAWRAAPPGVVRRRHDLPRGLPHQQWRLSDPRVARHDRTMWSPRLGRRHAAARSSATDSRSAARPMPACSPRSARRTASATAVRRSTCPTFAATSVVGKSNMGGSDAGNLSGGGTLGAGLGSQTQAANTNVSGSTAG